MSKLENISALLVATNSAFTEEAAFTTKTTRAELIRMLQATDFAVSEALKKLERNKEVYSAEVQKLNSSLDKQLEDLQEAQELNSSHVMQLEHLQEKCSGLEAMLADANQQLADCVRKNLELELRVSEQQAKLVATNKELADNKLYAEALQNHINKYKQQGFFDRLFGRTPE